MDKFIKQKNEELIKFKKQILNILDKTFKESIKSLEKKFKEVKPKPTYVLNLLGSPCCGKSTTNGIITSCY